MSKNILILAASPRANGNSDSLSKQFLQGAKAAGNEVELVFLREKKIAYCIACDGCKRNPGICIHKDDMSAILEKMIQADVIVLATPVYFYTMDAQMKTLIDRTFARYTEICDKEFYFIVTAADPNVEAMERTIEGFRGFTACLDGAKERDVIYGTGAWNKGEIEALPVMQAAYETGKLV